MKKIVITILILAITSIASVKIFADNEYTSINDNEDELLPTKEIPKKYEKDNKYVQLNNKMVNAMLDYNAGKLSKEEYLKIMAEAEKSLDTKKEIEAIEEDEQKFKEQIND